MSQPQPRYSVADHRLETLCPRLRIFSAMTNHEDIDGLAAEYVLGTLDGAERRQVNARRQVDASLSAAIDAWECRLAPLNERGGGIEPPAHLLDGILSRIASQAPQRAEAAKVLPLRRAAGHRRALMAAAALAACLVLAVVWSGTQQPTLQGHSKLDCGKIYKDFWVSRDPHNYARTAPERLAGISRMALRAYDACQAGDEQDAKSLLARLLGQSGERGPTFRERRAAAETNPRT
jgi:hypothetical protein